MAGGIDDDVQALVRLVKGGDGGAFGGLDEYLVLKIYGYVLRRVRGRHETAKT